MTEIKQIEMLYDAPISSVAIPRTFERKRDMFRKRWQIELPTYDSMKFQEGKTWEFYHEPNWVIIHWKNGYIWRYDFMRGFSTDNASIPDALQWYLQSNDTELIISSHIHDGYYQTKGAFHSIPSGGAKAEADYVLGEVSKYFGLGKFKADRVQGSVEKFGGKAWNEFEDRDTVRRFHVRKFAPDQIGEIYKPLEIKNWA